MRGSIILTSVYKLYHLCWLTSVHSTMYTLFTPLLYPSMTNSLPLHLYHEAHS